MRLRSHHKKTPEERNIRHEGSLPCGKRQVSQGKRVRKSRRVETLRVASTQSLLLGRWGRPNYATAGCQRPLPGSSGHFQRDAVHPAGRRKGSQCPRVWLELALSGLSWCIRKKNYSQCGLKPRSCFHASISRVVAQCLQYTSFACASNEIDMFWTTVLKQD